MSILIKNGRVLNPSENLDSVMDILIDKGVIVKKASHIENEANQIIDAKGCYVMPGLIDLHVHFRDPGLTYKEDIETGSRAAAKGGFTTVCCMPNTKPVVDSPETVKYIIDKGKAVGLTNVLPVGAVTKNMAGVEITDVEELKAAGICAISEDGKSVMNSGVYRKAMKNAKQAGIPVLAHCEDINLVEGGVINLGDKSKELGVKGISNAVEDVIALRDILLAKETGAKLHLCHCSTKDSVEMVRRAKEEGVKVTAEVCPHHFILTSDDIERDDPNYKMNPPLRTRKDVDALIEGLKEGYIQVISTDHAPHTQKDKTGSMRTAAFGIVGIETSFALSYTALVETGILTLSQLVEKMSYNPAQILDLPCGTLQKGHPADVIIADIKNPYTIHKADFVSKGKNTPFEGKEVKGKILYTICEGKIVYKDSAAK